MTRKLQMHPLTKPSVEKKLEKIFRELNENKKDGDNKRFVKAVPKKH